MTNQKEAIQQLIASVLDGTELHLSVDSYVLEEDLETGNVTLRCNIHDKRTGDRQAIMGQGVGIVDAFFHGLISVYSATYPSLKSIRFADFSIRAKLETGQVTARTDSHAEVALRIANSDGRETAFIDSSPSITRSAVRVVLEGVEFFINSERAFIVVYRALQHARQANRPDSVRLYTQQLATLVEATSYSDVIEQMRKSDEL